MGDVRCRLKILFWYVPTGVVLLAAMFRRFRRTSPPPPPARRDWDNFYPLSVFGRDLRVRMGLAEGLIPGLFLAPGETGPYPPADASFELPIHEVLRWKFSLKI